MFVCIYLSSMHTQACVYLKVPCCNSLCAHYTMCIALAEPSRFLYTLWQELKVAPCTVFVHFSALWLYTKQVPLRLLFAALKG